jgi:penicillin-binding protein 2
MIARAKRDAGDPAQYELHDRILRRKEDVRKIINKCAAFGLTAEQVEGNIRGLNDRIWNLRTFLAWARNSPDPNLIQEYGSLVSVPLSKAISDFEVRFPDKTKRDELIAKVDDIPEMDKEQPLLELQTEDDIFAAQLEFIDINDVQILPKVHRDYPYHSVAAQTIGWVGPATQERDQRLFEDDRLAAYIEGDLCGREDGVEYVCEPILRGRRGELVYDIDRQLIRDTEADFGDDVTLTLDIKLQAQIETYLTDPQYNPNADANVAVVVLQIQSGDILALVSVPTFDLNQARYDYGRLLNDPNLPLVNRAINQEYPPGSSVKPIILVAALEEKLVTADEIISCPAQDAPPGWPNCWIWKQKRAAHDWSWDNNARNAIKGSCNIYFSRVANRLDPRILQSWLFRFGYGHRLPLACPATPDSLWEPRQLRQSTGRISSKRPDTDKINSLEDVPPLRRGERPLAGMGQGNIRATPLQVANSFATIARGGVAKPPRLFLRPRSPSSAMANEPVDLNISADTLRVIYDGLDAVVNEPGGTAHKQFAGVLSQQGVRVYGKTGSTERPDHAWFAGFAEDRDGAKLAVAVVVEGGQHGSSDAAPLARDIIQLCVNARYVGEELPMTILQQDQTDTQ